MRIHFIRSRRLGCAGTGGSMQVPGTNWTNGVALGVPAGSEVALWCGVEPELIFEVKPFHLFVPAVPLRPSDFLGSSFLHSQPHVSQQPAKGVVKRPTESQVGGFSQDGAPQRAWRRLFGKAVLLETRFSQKNNASRKSLCRVSLCHPQSGYIVDTIGSGPSPHLQRGASFP